MSKISHRTTNFYKSYSWGNDRKSMFKLILSLNRSSLCLSDSSVRKIHSAPLQAFYLSAFTTSQGELLREFSSGVPCSLLWVASVLEPNRTLSRFNLGRDSIITLLVHCHAVLCWHNLLCGCAGRELKQLKITLPKKKDPFELNQSCDLAQHWALQTSAPVGEWWGRLAIFNLYCQVFSILFWITSLLSCHFFLLCAKHTLLANLVENCSSFEKLVFCSQNKMNELGKEPQECHFEGGTGLNRWGR